MLKALQPDLDLYDMKINAILASETVSPMQSLGLTEGRLVPCSQVAALPKDAQQDERVHGRHQLSLVYISCAELAADTKSTTPMSLLGFDSFLRGTAHVANGLAAFYIATGNDPACTAGRMQVRG